MTRMKYHSQIKSNSQIKLKTSILKSIFVDYSDPYIFVKGIIHLIGQGADTAATHADRNNKQVTFKNSPPFTDCITEINNTQVENDNIIKMSQKIL